MTTTEAWASEPSRPPWRMVEHDGIHPAEHAGECLVVDGAGHPLATFNTCRDAAYVCALVNGEAGPPRPMTVRYIRTDTWLGACHYCQPAYLLLEVSAMSTLAALGEHFRQVHPYSSPDLLEP